MNLKDIKWTPILWLSAIVSCSIAEGFNDSISAGFGMFGFLIVMYILFIRGGEF